MSKSIKTVLKVQGQIQLTDDELLDALRLVVLKRADSIETAVQRVVQQVYGYKPSRVEKDKELTKIVAIIDEDIAPGQKTIRQTEDAVKIPNGAQFTRKWRGFYNAAQGIFDELRKQKKHSISFKDFYDLILQAEDTEGGKLFSKKEDGKQVQIEEWRVKQYTSPSQLKKTPQMKGVRWNPKKNEFRF